MHGNKEYLETIYIYSNDWFCSKFSSTRHAQKLKHKKWKNWPGTVLYQTTHNSLQYCTGCLKY